MTELTRRRFLATSTAAALSYSALGSTASADAAPAVPAAAGAPADRAAGSLGDDRFGVNLHLSRFERPLMLKQLGLARAMGVRWVRCVLAAWHYVEPRPGEVTFERPDAQMQAVLDMGMRAMGGFGYAVQWATPSSPKHANVSGESMYPPADLNLYRKHVSRVVNRYKDHIKHWQVWNEPDHYGFLYRGAPEELRKDPQWVLKRRREYLEIQKAAYEAAKEADPSCFVLSGSFANGGSHDEGFIPWLAEHGLFDYCDAIDMHTYWKVANVERVVETARGLMRQAGVDKPVWMTEVGAALREDRLWIGAFSHEMQLSFAPKVLATAVARGIQRVFWYEGYTSNDKTVPLSDSGHSVSVTDGPVPVFWSLTAMYQLLRGAEYLGPAPFKVAEGQAITHVFGTPAGELTILWASDPGGEDNVKTSARGTLRWGGDEIPLVLSERPTILMA